MNRLKLRPSSVTRQRGIGLLEVLIAALVLAIGVAAVTKLQGDFFAASGESKARAEALAIAQSRLETMRNYMNEIETQTEFQTTYDVVSDANTATINGVNASYSREETIAANGEGRTVTVTVAWDDALGDEQSVALSTVLVFVSPRAPGDAANEAAGPLVSAPTGRAELGKGAAPVGATLTSNSDGTSLYDSGDGNLNLVFGGGNKIVLTLVDACDAAGGNCTDFVKISGRVFIDAATQSINPGEINVQASDAAFCTRFFEVGGSVSVVQPSTTSAALTASGDYKYFDYTCYLGGGWHGNIGLLLSGGIAQNDKVCMGDPVSANAWEAPVIGTRRAYRGMIYTKDTNGDPVVDANGDVVYESYGVADAAVIPNISAGEHPHDFVIGTMATSALDGSNCISAGLMVRNDANVNGTAGDLFEGNPEDFVCLNDGLLDAYDTAVYGSYTTCPYDPTDPPIQRHVIAGAYTMIGDSSAYNDAVFDAISFYTSDGFGNCQQWDPAPGNYTRQYACSVYDWGTGWTGTVSTHAGFYSLEVACMPSPNSFSNLTADTANNDMTCILGNRIRVNGTVTTSNANKVLDTVTGNGVSCVVTADGMSYSCMTDVFDTDFWSGTLTFTASGGHICAQSVSWGTGSVSSTTGGTSVLTGSLIPAGAYSFNLNIENNSNSCTP